jgi:carbonic anhydrase/acetyltransferase-like protein (isoleucine patch superfamily)
MIVPVNGIYPQLHQSVWVAPNATIVGSVDIGEKSSVWFNTVIRGDVFPMKIGRETNVQDSCVLHGTYNKCGVTLGNRVTIGHQVILHGCEVKDGSLIGMGAILMDKVVIGKHCLIGAGSLVTEESVFEDELLIMGRPAKAKRKLTPEEIQRLEKSADHYVMYTAWYTGKGGKIP